MVYQEQVTFILEAAPDDPKVSTPEFQEGLSEVSTALRDSDIKYSQRIMMFDSVDVPGYGLGQFTLAFAAIAAPVIGVAFGAWITGRAGRKLKLKVGDVELEANSPAEIDHLVAQALALKAQLAEQDAGR